MAKVTLTFEDTPEGLQFSEDFDITAEEAETSMAGIVGLVVVKVVEELLGMGEDSTPAEDVAS